MARAAKLWHLVPHDPDASRRLGQATRVSPVVAQLLLNRGISDPTEARQFLDSPLSALHPPLKLPGIRDAAERIVRAVGAGRRICVYGDYDADGITGTAILLGLLRKLQATVEYYVPNRLEEGYGVNAEALRGLAETGVSLVITVDCGIASVAEAEVAKSVGIELIVTDHHEMAPTLPDAATLVHPRLPGSEYPFAGLSGAGVAFKLAWAIAVLVCQSEKVTPDFREFLLDAIGFAALGLVADVVPLRDENRILVRKGLERLTAKPGVGIRALVEAAKLTQAISSEDVGYRLAPRLNAAGRLGCARLVVELLTTPNPDRAKELAEYLEAQNAQRQAVERKITSQAREMVEAAGFQSEPAIVVGSTEWHAGVVGIVAGRLAEQYARPVLVVALKEGDAVSTGSGRSISGFALHEALRACDGELLGHGGHAKAAGFKLLPSRLECLRAKFAEYAGRHFPDGPPPPRLVLDAEVPISALTFSLLGDIDKLEPYGEENPRPRFLAADVTIEGTPRRIGGGERHLSFRVRQGGSTMRAVGFGMGDRLDELMSDGGRCCLAFTPKINEWNGSRAVEMEVIDFQAGPQPRLG